MNSSDLASDSVTGRELKAPIKVVMLGPSLLQQGGMAGVQNLILKNISNNINISHISTHEEGPLLQRIYVFIRAVILLIYTIQKQNVDIIHLHVSEKGSVLRKGLLALIGNAFHIPLVIHTHGSEFHIFFEGLPQYLKSFISYIFRKSSQFIVLSESWKKYYTCACKLDSSQVTVLTNPVEVPSELPNRTGSKRVNFIFLGRIGNRKGAFDLLHAYAKLPEQARAQSFLTLAGDGEIEQAHKLASELNLTDHVKLLGWIDTTQRSQILNDSDVFILPSYNEGLPLSILEAMAWGLPVITTPIGGIPEIISHEESGFLVNPGNIDQIAEMMADLIKDESKRIAIGTCARSKIEPFDVHNYCNTLQKLYQSILLCQTSYLEDFST